MAARSPRSGSHRHDSSLARPPRRLFIASDFVPVIERTDTKIRQALSLRDPVVGQAKGVLSVAKERGMPLVGASDGDAARLSAMVICGSSSLSPAGCEGKEADLSPDGHVHRVLQHYAIAALAGELP